MRQIRTPARLPIFRSGPQAELLTRLYLDPERSWTARDLGRGIDVSRVTVDREIDLLEGAGLVTVERLGRTRMISAAVASPLFAPMRELIERTLGAEPRLRAALENLAGIEAAAVFGSWAAGAAAPESDIDLLVVGNVDHDLLMARLHPLGTSLARELNVVALTREELADRAGDENGFMARVLGSPLIDLIGDVRGLAGAG